MHPTCWCAKIASSTCWCAKIASLKVPRTRKGLQGKNPEGKNFRKLLSASPKPDPSKPHPCNMPQAKTEVALQFLECCAAETALQPWLFCSAEGIWTKSCAAANEKLHCNIEKLRCMKVALSCRFPAAFKPHV